MRRFEAMCGVAIKQKGKESLFLLILLIVSSLLSCAPVLRCTSVSLFPHYHPSAGLHALWHGSASRSVRSPRLTRCCPSWRAT